jgi:phosphatidylserine/phosphatidylglycerophosphate/cardiolipin synthase-like enzyme
MATPANFIVDVIVVDAFAAAAAVTEATKSAETLTSAAILLSYALPELAGQLNTADPLIAIIENHRVFLDDEDVGLSIQRLQYLTKALWTSPLAHSGRSPGFFTANDTDSDKWTGKPCLPLYEIMDVSFQGVPVPSPASAAKCCAMIEQIFADRARYLKTSKNACSCLSEWEGAHNVLNMLVNQGLEQLMVEEASQCLHTKLLPDESAVQRYWNETYQESIGSAKSNQSIPNTPIKVLKTRDEYLQTFTKYCLAAESTVQLSTCYVFCEDPAQRYIFMDLLPHCLDQNSDLQVKVLVDLMTLESAILKSAFSEHQGKLRPRTNLNLEVGGGITAESFLKVLPAHAPPLDAAASDITSNLDFWQRLLEIARRYEGRYQFQWFCVRDAEEKYRIKNHSKSCVVDRQVAIAGGSNVCPTLASATSELDVLMAGPAAVSVATTMDLFWNDSPQSDITDKITMTVTAPMEEEKKEEEQLCYPTLVSRLVQSEYWTDANCKVGITRSTPSSTGQDAILNVVLDKIASAQSSVLLCMGHANIPGSFAYAVRDATARGVQVQILVNSLYSCDLRTGQRDLFLSIRNLLKIAPKCQVYATAPSSLRDTDDHCEPVENKDRPPFLHAKYVVVDQTWSAVGSWNMWTRGAFYEMEHEAFIDSAAVAEELTVKFTKDCEATAVRLEKAQDYLQFCPSGCRVCQGFGPFFVE